MRTTFALLLVVTALFFRQECSSPGDLNQASHVLNTDVTLGDTDVSITSEKTGTISGGYKIIINGNGVFKCAGDVNIQVGIRFSISSSSNNKNFFESTNAIKLTGSTIAFANSKFSGSGSLFYSNGGVINFERVTVENVDLVGYFFNMGNSAGKEFTFDRLNMVGLNKTGSDGPVFLLSKSRKLVHFVDCNFSNFNVKGSLVVESVSGLKVSGSRFRSIRQTSGNGGSCFYINHTGNGEGIVDVIDNCIFDKCTINESNGGVIYYNFSNPNYETQIKGNKNQKQPGCATLVVNLCFVSNCRADNGQGGVFFVTKNGRVNLTNCTFESCFAKKEGGVLMASDYCVQIDTNGVIFQSCIVQYCSSNSSGGVCYYTGGEFTLYDSYFLLLHCDFFYCDSGEDGGVGYFRQAGKCRTNESVFYSCTAKRYGGAIKMFYSGMELANCTFSKCLAKYGGACNFLMNVEMRFYDCLLFNNRAEKFGGAVAYQRRTEQGYVGGVRPFFQMVRCYFTDNSVLDERGWGLDVVFMEDSDSEGTYNDWAERLEAAKKVGNFTGTYSKTPTNGKFRVYALTGAGLKKNFSEYIGEWDQKPVLLVNNVNGINSMEGCGGYVVPNPNITPDNPGLTITLPPCKDIAYASSRLMISFEYAVNVADGEYRESLITVQLSKTLTVRGYGRGDPVRDKGTRIFPLYDQFYSALFICHYPESGLVLDALSFVQSNVGFNGRIRSAVYLNTPDTTGFLVIKDCYFFSEKVSDQFEQFEGCLIYSMGHNVTVIDSTFDNFRTEAQHGGVIRFGQKKTGITYTTDLNLTVVSSEFISCFVNVSKGENGGGAVFVENSTITNFTLVRFEYCVGRALVFDYGRIVQPSGSVLKENCNHTFDKCVFVHCLAYSPDSEKTNFKGTALACLYATPTNEFVIVYFDHCYFGNNSAGSDKSQRTVLEVLGHDAGFIASGSVANAMTYWNKLVEIGTNRGREDYPNDEAKYFWDCLSDGQQKRLWTSSTNIDYFGGYINGGNEPNFNRYREYLNHTHRDPPLRVSHTSVGFNGEYCGCDHVPCNTIAYANSRTNPYFQNQYLLIAEVVNNETATVFVKDNQIRELKRETEEEPVKRPVSTTKIANDQVVPIWVSMNDSVHDFIRVNGTASITITDKFHILHNSSNGGHSLFYWETKSTLDNVLENLDISDWRNGTFADATNALTRGLLTLIEGKVRLKKVRFFTLSVDVGGSVIDVKGGDLVYEDSVVGSKQSGYEVSGFSPSDGNNSCVFRVSGGNVKILKVNCTNAVNTHAVLLSGFGNLEIDSCKFDSSVSNYNGSVIRADLKTGGQLIIIGTEFVDSGSNAAYGCGGAIYVELAGTGKLEFRTSGGGSKNKFTNCFASSSVSYGGAIFLYVEGIATGFNFNDAVSFSGSRATKGKSIYVHARELREIITANRFGGTYDTSKINETSIEKNVLEDGDDKPNGRNELAGTLNETLATATHIPLVYFFFRYTGPIYINNDDNKVESVHASGYDRFWCGRIILPCLTVSEANTDTTTHHQGVTNFKLVGVVTLYDKSMNNEENEKPSFNSPTYPAVIHTVSNREERGLPVLLHSPLTIESGVSVKAQLVLSGYTGADASQDYLYESTGVLNLINIDITPAKATFYLHAAASSPSSLPSLTVIRCGIIGTAEKIRFSTIRFIGGDLTITNSSFSNIESDNSDAVAVYAEISVDKKFSILNSIFAGCKTAKADGKGGALRVILNGNFAIEENYNTASMSNFTNCAVTGANGKGGAIYLQLVGTAYDYVFGGILNFSASSAAKGSHVYVEGTELSRTVITRKRFLYPQFSEQYKATVIDQCYENLEEDGSTLQGEKDPYDEDNSVPLRPYLIGFGGEVYVSKYAASNETNAGVDFNACGFWHDPCLTIKKAISNAIDAGLLSFKVGVVLATGGHKYDFVYPDDAAEKEVTVNVIGINPDLRTDVSTPEHVDINSHEVAVINAHATDATDTIDKGVGKVEVNGSLSFSPFAITPKSASVGVFIKVTSNGFLNVTDSEFSKGTFTSFRTTAQVIVIESGGGALFTKVSFTDIESTFPGTYGTYVGGTGSALLAIVASGKTLYLIGCKFTHCITGENSNGSAIHVTLKFGGIFSVSGTEETGMDSVFDNNGLDEDADEYPDDNKKTQFGGAIYLALGDGVKSEGTSSFVLDYSIPSYFEFVGKLTFSDNNKASCGENIFINHGGDYYEVINRQTFDFLLATIAGPIKNPPGFKGFVDGPTKCTDLTDLIISSDPVYVAKDPEGSDSAQGEPAKVECSKAFPCELVSTALATSGGTYTTPDSRSINVRLIHPGPPNGFVINTVLVDDRVFSDSPPSQDISAYSFKGIKLQGENRFEVAELVLVSLSGSGKFNFIRKLSIESIIFPVKDTTGLLFETREGSELSLVSCEFRLSSTSGTSILSLFKVLSQKFVFSSFVGNSSNQFSISAGPVLSLEPPTGKAGGPFDFKNARFEKITGNGQPILRINIPGALSISDSLISNVGIQGGASAIFDIINAGDVTINNTRFISVSPTASGYVVLITGNVLVANSEFSAGTGSSAIGGAIKVNNPSTVNFTGSLTFTGFKLHIYLKKTGGLQDLVSKTSFNYDSLVATYTAYDFDFYTSLLTPPPSTPLLNTLLGQSDKDDSASLTDISLYYYLLDEPVPVFVSPDSTDISKCGYYTHPCRSFAKAIGRTVLVSGVLSINVVEVTGLSLPLPSTAILAAVSVSEYILSGVPKFDVDRIGDADLHLPPVPGGGSGAVFAPLSVVSTAGVAYLAVDSFSLTLNYITVSISGGITADVFFFKGETSSLTLNHVKIIGVGGVTSTISLVSIISYESSAPLNIVDSEFYNIKLNTGSVISIDGAFKSVVIDSTNFTDLESTGNGVAVSTKPGSVRTLIIKESNFVGCKSTGGDGGALYVELTNGGNFTVEDGSFGTCSATGNGGGIYLKLGGGFSLVGDTSFIFTGASLDFDSNTAVYGNNIFVDGSDGIDLSDVVSATTFAFGRLNVKPVSTTAGGECNDWMGYNLDNNPSDLRWLNRYIDHGCFLFADGCPAATCVKEFDVRTSKVECVETCVNNSDGEPRKEETGEEFCIEVECSDRTPQEISAVVNIDGVCGDSYSNPYKSTCGVGCFLVVESGGIRKCTADCPEHSKKQGDECVELKCVEQVVCPDGKISKEDYCINDSCVSKAANTEDCHTDCGVAVLKTKDIFGRQQEENVCRSIRSATYREDHKKAQCGKNPGVGGQPCYLNASETGLNKCIPDCEGAFDVKDDTTYICTKKPCKVRTQSDVLAYNDSENPCGEDCFHFADFNLQDVTATRTTTTQGTSICEDECPLFYYADVGSTKCNIKDCVERSYTNFVETDPSKARKLTCGPHCFYRNYSTSCVVSCNINFFDIFPRDSEGNDFSGGDGWGYCDLRPCPLREADSSDGNNCKVFVEEQCGTNTIYSCNAGGVSVASESECVYYQKESELLVGGKSSDDSPGCGSGDRVNCKTVSYTVNERALVSCVSEVAIATIKLTADVIETAKATVRIDITGINLRSQSSVKRLTINMVYRASFIVGSYNKPTTITNLVFNTFTVRDTINFTPLFYTDTSDGKTPQGGLTLNSVIVNYAVSNGLAGNPTLKSGFSAWVAELKGITVNLNKSLVDNRLSAASLSSSLSSSAYRLTRLDLSVMFDLDFSDDPEFESEFLDRFSPVIMSLTSSTLASRSLSFVHKQSNEHTGVCSEPFPNPAILLSSVVGTFEYSNFSNINTGAIKLNDSSNVTLNGVAFLKNRISNSLSSGEALKDLPSMRHNVYVSAGTNLTVINLIAESSGSYFLQDGRVGENSERIIIAKDGSVENNVITPFNELFTPIFTDAITTPSGDGGSFILTLRGGMFFPCDPILTLYRGGEELKRYEFAKNEFNISGESSILVNITSNVDNYFEAVGEYKALLEYEPHQRSALYTYNTTYGIPPPRSQANLKPLWWILVALGILILLLLALVIFLYIRMKLKQKELEQDAAEARIRAQVRRDQQINKQRADQRKLQEKKTVKEPVKKADRIFANDINSNEDSFGAWEAGADEWVVDARRCEHPFGVVQCDRRRTLFALYTELSAQALNTSSPQETFQSMLPQKLRNPMAPMLGLAQLMNRLYQENPNVPVDHISPHTLLVSTKGSLALVLKKDAVKNMSSEGREVGGAFESIRWNAPELKFEETPTLASDIFSYSLVAWQIATPMHEVPFAEVDAQSASTRMATGYRPVTQGLDYRLVGLFENAWKQEPDERSTVQEIIDTLQAGGPPAGGDQWDSDGSAKGGAGNSGWKAPSSKKDNAPLLDDAPNPNESNW